MATQHIVTDRQINSLLREAGRMGDLLMADICRRALGQPSLDWRSITVARAECARVIAEAEAQS